MFEQVEPFLSYDRKLSLHNTERIAAVSVVEAATGIFPYPPGVVIWFVAGEGKWFAQRIDCETLEDAHTEADRLRAWIARK